MPRGTCFFNDPKRFLNGTTLLTIEGFIKSQKFNLLTKFKSDLDCNFSCFALVVTRTLIVTKNVDHYHVFCLPKHFLAKFMRKQLRTSTTV